jgi:hypothetical protein
MLIPYVSTHEIISLIKFWWKLSSAPISRLVQTKLTEVALFGQITCNYILPIRNWRQPNHLSLCGIPGIPLHTHNAIAPTQPII